MQYADYVAWLRAEYSSIALEPGCTEIGPLHNPTILPNSPPWNMDWAVYFPDGKHAYLYERWFPVGPRLAGRVRRGSREHFSFHYGTTGPSRRLHGFPARDKVNHPAIIRIDCDKYGPHIHFGSEADHIAQNRIHGMKITDVNPFEFMRSVLNHRKTGDDFSALMKFTVIP